MVGRSAARWWRCTKKTKAELLVVFDLGSSHVLSLRSTVLEALGGVVELKEVRRGGGLVGNRVRELGRTLLSRQLHTTLTPFDARTVPERWTAGWALLRHLGRPVTLPEVRDPAMNNGERGVIGR